MSIYVAQSKNDVLVFLAKRADKRD